MLLSDFFNTLTYGELSQVELGGSELGSIQVEDYPNLISHVNMGLRELYKRFPLNVKKHTLTFVLDQNNYILALDDLLVIEKIFAEDGTEYALNDAGQEFSIYQTSFNTISIPFNLADTDFAKEDTTLIIQYKASPVLVDPATTDAALVDLPITDQYIEALLNYVTYRVFSGINANNPDTVNYYNKFEAACSLLRNAGLFHKDAPTNTRLENNGWL